MGWCIQLHNDLLVGENVTAVEVTSVSSTDSYLTQLWIQLAYRRARIDCQNGGQSVGNLCFILLAEIGQHICV